MKTFQLIVLGGFGFLAVMGVILFATFSGRGGAEATGTVTIWGILPQESVEEAISILSSTNTEFGKVSYVEKSASTFSGEVANAIASGTGPDLVLISQELLLSEEDKLQLIPYTSISQRTYIDEYVPIATTFLTTEGTYGIPFVVDPMVMYYNRSLLGNKGIVSPPSTWESILAYVPSLTQKKEDQSIAKSGIALGEYENVHNARGIISTLLLQAGVAITNRGQYGIESALRQEVGQFGTTFAESALSFYTQFANPIKTAYSWNRSLPDSQQMFLAGDLALYLGFASERPYLSAANPNLHFDMAPMPQPQTSSSHTGYGIVYAFALPKASQNPTGAMNTAFALANISLPSVFEKLSMAPANRSFLVSEADDLYTPVFYPEALTVRGWLSPAPSRTDSIFSSLVSNITTGRETVQKAILTADEEIGAEVR